MLSADIYNEGKTPSVKGTMTIRVFKSVVNPSGCAGSPVSGAAETQKPSPDGQVTMCDFTGKDAFSRAAETAVASTMSYAAEVPTPSVGYTSADEFLRSRGIKTA